MRLHSITSTIASKFVYLPTESDWLGVYEHELTTFPSGKHDDQADSTSQALDWFMQGTHVYGALDYYRRERLAEKLGLPRDFEITQWDEGEEILAANKTSGQKIRWTGQSWVGASSNIAAGPSDTCPKCASSSFTPVFGGAQKRCQQCGEQWPPGPRVQQILTQRNVLMGSELWDTPGGTLWERWPRQ
jgi:hypothetical protein